jgi:hypothetical protein
MDKPEPKFFLQDELIYFLKNNMSMVVVSTTGSTNAIGVGVKVAICGHLITETSALIHLPPPQMVGMMSPMVMEQKIIQ